MIVRAVLAACLLATPAAVAQQGHELKSPTAARLVGLVVPGGGHMYAGEVGHGILYMAGIPGVLLAGALADAPVCALEALGSSECERNGLWTASLIVAGAAWAWSIFDAGRAAHRTNARRAGRTSLLIEPHGHGRMAVRLGVRLRLLM
ncbi:MAG TPA: hypothetical protein VFU01_02125 [Gemmatimonadaceae bacterium]|nr:hypothetical protein [Gemmatimonadaceae bacterium]